MKRTAHIFSCLILIFFTQICSGQSLSTKEEITDFLRNYKQPNYSNLSFSIDPRIDQSSSSTPNFSRDQFFFRGRAYLNYIKQKDSTNTNLYVTLAESFLSGKENEIKSGDKNYVSHYLYVNGSKDFYFKEKAFLSLGYTYQGSTSRTLVEDWRYVDDHDLNIPLGIGFGRPYSVKGALDATNYFNDLECNGIAVDRSYTKEFADLLATQRYRRVIDNRLYRIKNKTEIYSFLKDKGVTEFSPLSAAIIDDSYEYEARFERLSGFRFLMGVEPGIRTESERTDIGSTSDVEYFLSPFLKFDYYLPISEDWQFNLFTKIDYENNFSTENENQTNSYVYASLIWNPNNRFRSNLGLVYNSVFSEVFDSNILSLGYSLNYYFSPRLSLNLSANIERRWNEVNLQKQNTLSQTATMGFSYFIF